MKEICRYNSLLWWSISHLQWNHFTKLLLPVFSILKVYMIINDPEACGFCLFFFPPGGSYLLFSRDSTRARQCCINHHQVFYLLGLKQANHYHARSLPYLIVFIVSLLSGSQHKSGYVTQSEKRKLF